MALWFTPPCGGYGNPLAGRRYQLQSIHANNPDPLVHDPEGILVWTKNWDDVYYYGLNDNADPLSNPYTIGCVETPTGLSYFYYSLVDFFHAVVAVRSSELDRIDAAYNDAVDTAQMLITLDTVSVNREVLQISTSPIEGVAPWCRNQPLYDDEGNELPEHYWWKDEILSTTEGLQVAIFGLIERDGVIAADFLGGGGSLDGLDSNSTDPQVVDCSKFVSSYLANRVNYIGFDVCFIPTECNFNDILGPFDDIEFMMKAVEQTFHTSDFGANFIGWSHPDPAYRIPIFAGTSTRAIVRWLGADSTKGVVNFDPAAVTMQTDSGLSYQTVPG